MSTAPVSRFISSNNSCGYPGHAKAHIANRRQRYRAAGDDLRVHQVRLAQFEAFLRVSRGSSVPVDRFGLSALSVMRRSGASPVGGPRDASGAQRGKGKRKMGLRSGGPRGNFAPRSDTMSQIRSRKSRTYRIGILEVFIGLLGLLIEL